MQHVPRRRLFCQSGDRGANLTILRCVSEVTLLIVSVVPFILRQRTSDPAYDESIVGVTYLRFE